MATETTHGPGVDPRRNRLVRIEVAEDSSITAVNVRGVRLPIGSGRESDLFNPVELLLAAIGGCSAIDFAEVLARRGHPLAALVIETGGYKAEDQRLESITVRYELPEDVYVPDEDLAVARRLTAEVLCTVSRTVELASPVDHIVVRATPSGDVIVGPSDAMSYSEAAVKEFETIISEKEEGNVNE